MNKFHFFSIIFTLILQNILFLSDPSIPYHPHHHYHYVRVAAIGIGQ